MKEPESELPSDVLANATDILLSRYKVSKDNPELLETTFLDFLRETEKKPLPFQKRIKLEFADDLDWVNVSQPLSLSALHGKIVILDFFTYCCINCVHVLAELHALEKLFPIEDGLVVVGVHSPKFEHEKLSINVLAASKRCDIKHPIVNDPGMALWSTLGINCWPSLVVINPSGVPIMLLMGEGHRAFLESFLRVALPFFAENQNLEKYRLELNYSKEPKSVSHLRFPGKIACNSSGLFAVVDVGNNRILIVDESGLVVHKIGGNKCGYVDGDFDSARFHHPQGVDFYNDDIILVADTENHVIREISLSKLNVRTIVGVGRQGRDRKGGETGITQEISSPWDISVFRTRDMDMSFHFDEKSVNEKTVILIAMAGTHQIWGYFPEGIIWWKFRMIPPQSCISLVGTGVEENRNNCYPSSAAFAQPSGLTIAEDFLYIADSESSSIRKVSLRDGKVLPVVGGDRNPQDLFSFGDIDGKQFHAKLQHPLCVHYNKIDGKLYVTDTYNNKVKTIDRTKDEIVTLPIKDETGKTLVLNEPSGLCVSASGKTLLISDTNKHEIYSVDLNSLVAKRFQLDFRLLWASGSLHKKRIPKGMELYKSAPFCGNESLIKITIVLAEGLQIPKDSAQKWSIRFLDASLQASSLYGTFENMEAILKLHRLPREEITDNHYAIIDVTLNLCDAKCCHSKRFSISLLNATQESTKSLSEASIKVIVTQSCVTLE